MLSSSFPSASVQHTSFCLFSESSLNMASNSFWARSASSSTTNFISWSFWDVILGTQTVKFGLRPMCTSHTLHVHNWTELQHHLYTPILPSTGGPHTDTRGKQVYGDGRQACIARVQRYAQPVISISSGSSTKLWVLSTSPPSSPCTSRCWHQVASLIPIPLGHLSVNLFSPTTYVCCLYVC